MRTLLPLLALACLASTAFAGPGKTTTCSVMNNNKVDIAAATKAHHYIDYKNKRYYFCCADCIASFKKDPAKFAKYGKPIPKTKTA